MGVEVKIRMQPAYDAIEFSPAEMSQLAHAAMAGMEKYVRYDTGNMNRSAHVEGDSVVYSAPYSKHPFMNTRNRVTKSGHPQAAPRWDLAYQASGAEELCEEAARIVDGR